MKMTMELTLDGLVRALRWKAHDLAERAGRAYLSKAAAEPGRQETPRRETSNRNDGDREDGQPGGRA